MSASTEGRLELTLGPSILEFVASTEQSYYWVMPLSNFIHHFLQQGEIIGQHPLRLNLEARIVEFLWQGKPAFIQPLLDYSQRKKLLESGESPHLLTALMVGEIGDNPTDVDDLETWFPSTLLRVLGFATGHDVAAPWIEFRDAEGKLVKRIHRGMGAPDFDKGRRVIEEHPHPLTAIFAAAEQNVPLTVKVTQNHLRMLLEAAQRTPFCQTSTYFVLLHQALLAGTYGGQKSDERLTLLFRAFDCLCKEHDFKKIVWQDDLQANDKIEEMRILSEASKEIRVLAKEAGKRGDSKGVTALGKIAQRVMTADQTDRDFGRAMSMLVEHFKFHDEAVMDAYFAANPLSTTSTWAGVLSLYRNAAIHNGFFDTSNPDFSTEKLHYMNVHLHDLLARILLVMSGYDGPYHPTPKIWVGSQDYIDRIQPGSPAIELGYE